MDDTHVGVVARGANKRPLTRCQSAPTQEWEPWVGTGSSSELTSSPPRRRSEIGVTQRIGSATKERGLLSREVSDRKILSNTLLISFVLSTEEC